MQPEKVVKPAVADIKPPPATPKAVGPVQGIAQTPNKHDVSLYKGKSAKPKSQKKQLSKRAANHEIKEYFVENLSMLLSTDVTIGEALITVSSEMPSKKVKKVIENMVTQIDEGSPFWQALSSTGLLTNSAVALIRVGEDSGRLPENLRVVADQMHKTNMMAARVRSALMYPTFLIVLLFIVGTGIGIFLLPKLSNIFNGLDVQLGLMTRLLLGFGTFMGKFGLLLAGSFIIVMSLIIFGMLRNPVMRVWGEAILYHLPGIKRLLYESELARFGFILGSLLEAGLPIVEALSSLSDSMATKRYRELASYLQKNIEEGQSFSIALEKYKDRKVLPGTVRQLVISAEKSGNLSKTLLKIGTIFEDKATITATNLETMLEPIILVIIAVAVLFIALAVVLPIYSLIGGLDAA